jgi:AraC-like DNA-binding protein
MWPSFDFTNVPHWTYEEWADSLRTYPWGSLKVFEPKTFRTLVSRRSGYGFELGALKHEYGHAYSVKRDHEDVRSDNMDLYHVLFQAAGSASVIQNDQVIELTPGSTVLLDAVRPSLFVNHGGIQYHLVLPREPLISAVGLELQGGVHSSLGTCAGRALGQLIFENDEGGESSDWANNQMQRVIYELVAVLFEPKFDLVQVPNTALKRVCDIIRDRHVDPDLTPSMVAAEAAMSLRKLQTLFTSRGLTCTKYINSIRLEHASFLIRRRAFLHTNEFLSQISFACGYRDHNYFVRVFRRKFGKSPRAYANSSRDRP